MGTGRCVDAQGTSNVAQGLQLGSDLTGVDLAALLSRLGGGSVEDGNGRAVTERGTTPR